MTPDRLIHFLLRFRWLMICLVSVSLGAAVYGISKIRIDNDTVKSVPPDFKARLDYEKLKSYFPAPFNILFLAEFNEGSLSEKIDSLRAWSRQFRALPGIKGVNDLTTLQVPVRRGFLGLGSSFVVPPPSDTLDETVVRRVISDNAEFSGLFISGDESRLGMIIALEWGADRKAVFDAIFAKIDSINSSSRLKTYVTSESAVSYFFDKEMRRNFGLLLPICFMVVFLILFLIFRNVLHVFASLAAVGAALVWTFGLMGLLKVPFSIVISIVPVIIFPIGVADAIHIISDYKKRRPGMSSKAAAIAATYRDQLLPCWLTSFTTFAGFASFTLSRISWNRTFGIVTGIAVLFCYFFNVVLLPLFLSFDRTMHSASKPSLPEGKMPDRFWSFFIDSTIKSRRWIFPALDLAVPVAIGLRNGRVENNFMMMLRPDNQLRRSDDFIARHFGGTRFFSVVLEKRTGDFSAVGDWQQIDSLVDYLKTVPGVGNVTSLVPLINRISFMLTKKRISSPAISLVTSSGGFFGRSYGAFISNFLTSDRLRTRIQVTCRNDESVRALDIARFTEAYAEKHLRDYSVLVSGPAILTEAMSAALVDTLIGSLILTFVPVFLCLVFFFRSLKAGIYSILPIALLTLTVYSLMGIFNVSINMVTVVIMNTCIGIGVDNSIHFISGYLLAKRKGVSAADALVESIRKKGNPILFNTIVVGVGFGVLCFSTFPPIRDFGLLVLISMFVAAAFCMVQISVLIMKFGLGQPSSGKGIA